MYKALYVDGFKLAYKEQNPTAAYTIFFIHGNSVSSKMWNLQFASPLFANYRLIALELPAHGRSDAFDDYSLPNLGRVVASGLEELCGGSGYIIVGFSLGTNVLAEMLRFNIHPAGIVLLGPSIVGEKFPLHKIGVEGCDSLVLFTDNVEEQRLKDYIKVASLSRDGEMHRMIFEDFQKVASPFRSMLLQTALEGSISDEVELLKNAEIPLLIIFGQDEKVINPDYLDEAGLRLYNKIIYKLTGASHFVNLDKPEETNELMAEYCRSTFGNISAASTREERPN